MTQHTGPTLQQIDDAVAAIIGYAGIFPFHPTLSLAQAVMAADKVNLFRTLMLFKDNDDWVVGCFKVREFLERIRKDPSITDFPDDALSFHAATPQEAISRAVAYKDQITAHSQVLEIAKIDE